MHLVFIEPNKIDAIPFTASDVIATYAEVKHHAIQQIISKHETDLKEFGVIAFEMRKPPKGSKGGKPERIYRLNEQQATLLMTYLKNTEPVRKFKKELVKQFYSMREELTKRQIGRIALKPIRRALTDVIQDNPDHSQWDYKHFTDLAYMSTVGMTAARLRRERNAPRSATAIDYMTSDEIDLVIRAQDRISVLYEMGMDYHAIKELFKATKPKVVGSTF